MTRINWSEVGSRIFEAGIDRGVLYVGDAPGVPWVGLTSVSISKSGGEPKPRYVDGVKVSNYSSPRDFEATIEAYTYPREFEQCDGTASVQNGLRAMLQKPKPFGMVYRTKLGNEASGLDHAYKLHIIYDLRAEPSDRPYSTLGENVEPMLFSWNVTARTRSIPGFGPTPHFEIDSRDVPAQLLQDIEDVLYGDSTRDPSLPTAAELIFMFDSFEDLVYDAGGPLTPVFATYDAGTPTTAVVDTIDGGAV